MMSRPVAGVRAKSIIVTVPGSPKAAKENLEAIIKYLPHACMQAIGANSRQSHAGGVKKLEADVGITSPTELGQNDSAPPADEDQSDTAPSPVKVSFDEENLLKPPRPSKKHQKDEEPGLISGGICRLKDYHRRRRSRSHSRSHSRSVSGPVLRSPSAEPSPPASPSTSLRRSIGSERTIVQDQGDEPSSPITYGCGHHHHGPGHAAPKRHTSHSQRTHNSNDPNAGPTGRYRESPYPMLSVDNALDVIAANTPKPRIIEVPVNEDLVGYVLAEDVYAAEAVPAYRASIVDGYAIVAPEYPGDGTPSTKGDFPVMSISHAEAGAVLPKLEPGEVARVTTGAPIPEGATAVVMVEDTELVSSTPDGKEEGIISVLTDEVRAGENVREPGSDVQEGTRILEQHDLITGHGGEIGLLASTGIKKVRVYAKPVIGVLSTGDELVAHDDAVSELRYGQIRDSNRPSLLSSLQAWGYPVVDLGIARDTPASELEERLRSALRGTLDTPGVDIIITTGGVSMGELDLLKPTVERQLGGTIHFGRVAMKPGKPTTFATIPFKPNTSNTRESRLLFGLPGNPASALVTLNLFVLPCIHQMTGRLPPYGLRRVITRIEEQIRPDPKRREYHRAYIYVRPDGKLSALSTGGQRSSRVGSLKGANGLLIIEPDEDKLRKGDKVNALLMGNVGTY